MFQDKHLYAFTFKFSLSWSLQLIYLCHSFDKFLDHNPVIIAYITAKEILYIVMIPK